MSNIIEFFRESYAELRRVTWLTRKEVMGSTMVILILIAILSVFVAAVDWVFIRLVGAII